MPIYEYGCESCGNAFSKLTNMSAASQPVECPECGGKAGRIYLSAPRLNTMPASIRKAHQTNERSAHEPRMSKGHVCGSNCHHHKKPAAEQNPNVMKSQNGKRPWMLGH